VAHACNPSYSEDKSSGGLRFEASLGKYFPRPYFKQNKTKQNNTTHHKKTGLVEWLKV
jgi:hypothetical protein